MLVEELDHLQELERLDQHLMEELDHHPQEVLS